MLLDFSRMISCFLDDRFVRPVKRNRPRCKNRSATVEPLEPRTMLTAPLVADVLQGNAGTTVFGTVYEDLDSNGVKTPGENGVSGWTVYLDLDNSGTLNNDAAGEPEPSAVTNVDGDYVISHLIPGTYRVSEVVQSGWTPTALVSQDVDVQLDRDTRVNFFNFAGGDILGTVWNDLDEDGFRATDPVTGEFTEPGLSSWTIFLDLNNNLALDSGEPNTLTDANGKYAFVNLPANDYEVTEVLPAGWDPTKKFDIRQTASVVALQQVTQDFANFSLVNGSIQGTIWNDLNADGLRATDTATGVFTDPALTGWTVFLDLNVDGVAQLDEPSTVTTSDGEYAFISLPAGDYEVTEVLPSGWYVSPTFDTKQTVAVFGGEKSTAGDFANFTIQNGSIRGTIWNDLNRDGIRNVNLSGVFTDPGLEDWQVFLDLNRNKLADFGEPVALTDVNGAYSFADLQVGDYEIQEILPSGWETTATYDNSQTVTVFSGSESVARDFANFNLSTAVSGTVAGTVWNDVNGNGVRDTNASTGAFTDLGLGNWIVFVDLNSNRVLDAAEPNATSSPDGSYTISGVNPGTVSIIEVAQSGWIATSPPSGSQTFALKNGERATGLDFGNYTLQEAAIHGSVFADSNKNGTRDAGERGLEGIVVYLDTNDNGTLDAAEPQITTSSDLFYTPAVDEAGAYSFTHLAVGTYTVRTLVPATLSLTPAAELTHIVTLAAAEVRSGVNTAAVFRSNEIHGVKFDDSNGNHLRDAGEPGVGGVTIYIDLDRDDILDLDEPTTLSAADGSYSFASLTPGAYIVREVLDDGYETSYPTTTGGVLWPAGVSNPAVGIVSPTSITTSLAAGAVHLETVSITLPNTGALTNLVDVFLLFDDTGSFVNNSPIVRAAFPDIIAQLQAALPGIDLGFGVGRFEEYGNFAYEYSTGRPFILNQPIVAASTAGYMTAIQAALNRTTPGYGGDGPETDIEALYQLVTGVGFDGNNNGSVLDSGNAGLASTQLSPGNSGDVPSFASFQADASNSVMAAAGNIGGGGFRSGALPIFLTATDIGFAYQPHGETTVTGVGGVSLSISELTGTSRSTTPYNSGAGLQQTVTALNALGALVIGLGTNPDANVDPRQGLEALSTLTGAVNRTTTTIANGTADPIAPGDPLYFQISSGFAGSVASGVVSAIQNAVTNVAVDITVQASDPRVRIVNHTGVRSGIGSGQTATFDIEFVGDGVPHRFDLQFVRAGTNVVLGSIPVVIGTPIPGDGYEFEDLEEGEIEDLADFGSHLSSGLNQSPVAADGSLIAIEDTATSGTLVATDSDSPSLIYGIVTNPSHGTMVITDMATGAYAYTPVADYNGPDSFTFRVTDGTSNSNVSTVSIAITEVNDAPIANADTATVDEDSTGNPIAVLTNDTKGPANESAQSVTVTMASALHGTVAINLDGTLSYTPAGNYHGPDTISYSITDNGTTNGVSNPQLSSSNVNVTVSAINDESVAADGSLLVTEDTAQTGTLVATDLDSATQTFSLVANPSHGTVVITDAATGAYTYNPAPNYNGPDSFTFQASDGALGSNVANVSVTVSAVNDVPTAGADSYSLTAAFSLNVSAPGLLLNDLDVEGDPLAAALFLNPAHGILTFNSDGSFSYIPHAGYVGTDSFVYQASDGTLSSPITQVNLVINPVVPPTQPQFVVVDDSKNAFFAYTTSGDVVKQAPLSSNDRSPQGVTTNADGSRIWVAETTGIIFVYDAQQKQIGRWQANDLEHVTGVATDGTDIWLVDSKTDSIHRFAGACSRMSGKVSATNTMRLNSGNKNPTDMITDGPHFWVLNDTSTVDKVFRYSMSGALEGNWTIDRANSNPTGLTLNPDDQNQFWILDGKSRKLFSYLGGASRTSGNQNASAVITLSRANREAEGVIWIRSAVIPPVTSATLDTVFQNLSEELPNARNRKRLNKAVEYPEASPK